MSLHEYRAARDLVEQDVPFYALIMAAIMRADSGNVVLLRDAFPDTYVEVDGRYNAPGGLLVGEPGRAELDSTREALGMGSA